jgi:SAM-dependent MidA family methyltransferase
MKTEILTPLPELTEQQAGHCAKAREALGQMERALGPIYFDRYMDFVLYDARLGYYQIAAETIGPAGDFVTLPESTPLFARTLASVAADLFRAGLSRNLIEVGPGTGRLSLAMSRELLRLGCVPDRHLLLEPNLFQRGRQEALWAQKAIPGIPLPEWLDQLPVEGWSGFLVLNEIVDAWPVALMEKAASGWFEWGVGVTDGALSWRRLPLRSPTREMLETLESECGTLPVPYRTEWNRSLGVRLRAILTGCREGCAMVIDYGYPKRLYYHPERCRGTLACYLDHRTHADPLYAPGAQDITAMVDFTALAEAMEGVGWTLAGFARLAPFVLVAGAWEEADLDGHTRQQWIQDVLRLTGPEEAGELFRVMMCTKGQVPLWPGWTQCDESDRL